MLDSSNISHSTTPHPWNANSIHNLTNNTHNKCQMAHHQFLICHHTYTCTWRLQVWELWSIGNYDLRPLWQTFPIDSNVNLLCNNDFLHQFVWKLWLENEQNIKFLGKNGKLAAILLNDIIGKTPCTGNYNLKMSKIDRLFLSYTTILS